MDGVPKLTANELRRQRDRERYASLSVEKAALVQKNHENRNRKNSATTSGTCVLRDITNLSLHNGSQTVDCQPSFQPVPSSTPGVLGDITNLSAVERRRKRARDKYASMSPEEKERLLQKNHTPLTPANVLTLDGSDDYSWLRRNDAYERRACCKPINGESEDNYYQNGDTSQELFQPPSMTRGWVEDLQRLASGVKTNKNLILREGAPHQ
uniref:Uncharacterized protein n=1 Tax=Oryza punctata TaxID=4537 RepID=A0A0E0K3D6_ORYPU